MAINYEIKSKINTYLNMTEEHLEKFQRLYEWSATAFDLTVQEKMSKPIVREGDIFYCNLGFNVGSEIDKTRPCVVISTDIHNSTGTTYSVAPITNSGSEFTYHVFVNEDIVEMKDPCDEMVTGVIKVESSRAVSKARLGRKVGRLTSKGSLMVKKALLAYHNINADVIMSLFPEILNDKEVNHEKATINQSTQAEPNNSDVIEDDNQYTLSNNLVKYRKDQMITLKGDQLISLKGDQEVKLKDGRDIILKSGQKLFLKDGQPLFLKEGQVLSLNNAVAI